MHNYKFSFNTTVLLMRKPRVQFPGNPSW